MEEEAVYGIYCIQNKINQKCYIGKSTNILKRWNQHIKELKRSEKRNKHFQNSWNKYGEENFEFSVIEQCKKDRKILNEREKYWIAFFKSNNETFGYNKTNGGDGGDCITYSERKEHFILLNRRSWIEKHGEQKTQILIKAVKEKQKNISYEKRFGPNQAKKIKEKESLSAKLVWKKRKDSEEWNHKIFICKYCHSSFMREEYRLHIKTCGKPVKITCNFCHSKTSDYENHMKRCKENPKNKEKGFKKECPYCYKICSPQNYSKSHGDKCLKKIENQNIKRTTKLKGKKYEKIECQCCHRSLARNLFKGIKNILMMIHTK
jgi:group I intron endonuclease